MACTYTIDKALRTAFLSATGTISQQDLRERGNKLIHDQDWQPGFNILTDYTEASLAELNYEKIQELVEYQLQVAPILGAGKCAVVAPRALEFGIARIWESLTDNNPISIKIFHNRAEAETWLGLKSN